MDATRPTITLADLQARVGTQIGSSRWFLVDQARIDRFADVTEDHQFIHVDPDAAAQTPFGSTIAHGFLTLSLLSAMLYDAVPAIDGAAMGVNYGFDKIRFLSPVPVGAQVRGHFTLADLQEKRPGQITNIWDISVEIQGSTRPALAAQWIGLTYLQPQDK